MEPTDTFEDKTIAREMMESIFGTSEEIRRLFGPASQWTISIKAAYSSYVRDNLERFEEEMRQAEYENPALYGKPGNAGKFIAQLKSKVESAMNNNGLFTL